MSFTNTSPLMNMILPIPTQELGPAWAQELYNALYTTNDSHNHTSGNGAPITQNSFNFTGNVSFQGFATTNMLASVYNNQGATISPLTSPYYLYVSGGNLYYNSTSTSIQITTASAVNATSSGISDGSGATAAFVSKVLVVNKASNTPGNIQAGSYIMGDDTTDGFFVTLQPPSLTGSYSLTMPAIPGATSFMQLDTSGNITASVAVSGGLTYSNLSSSAGILGTQIATGTITNYSISPTAGITSGQQATQSNVITSTLNTTITTQAPTLAVVAGSTTPTITPSGQRLVRIELIPAAIAPTTSLCYLTSSAGTLSLLTGSVVLQKSVDGGFTFAAYQAIFFNGVVASGIAATLGPVTFIDNAFTTGSSVQYRLQANISSSGTSNTMHFTNCKLIAFEI